MGSHYKNLSFDKHPDIYFIDRDVFPKSLLRQIISKLNIFNNIKYIFKLFHRLIRHGDSIKIDKFININKSTSKSYACSLMVYEDYKDFQVQSSKSAISLSNISEDCPFFLTSIKNINMNKSFKFSVFLGTEIKYLKNITLEGYIEKNKSENFQINIDQSIIFNLSKPSYWIEVVIDFNDFNFSKDENLISIYLTNINLKKINRNDSKKTLLYLSDETYKNNVSKKLRPVFLLSFDGITTEDVLNNSNYLESNKFIREFSYRNTWFNNAVTSSTVTASSAACLMTGKTLSMHNMYVYSSKYLSPSLKILSSNLSTLGEKARSVGLRSYGLFSFGKWSPQYGYSRGFTDYKCISGRYKERYPWFEEIMKYTLFDPNSPLLFMMHHPGGHAPFLPIISASSPDHEYSAYENSLHYIDNLFNSIINAIKSCNIYDDSLIIFLSDHGRSLSNYKRTDFQFHEDRLRVPLIIKNPDWDIKSNIPFNTKNHISAQTFVHETICTFLGIKNNCSDVNKLRIIDGVNWVSETIDYSSENSLGIAGYDKNFKYTIYFNVHFDSFTIGKYRDLYKYPLSHSGIADKNRTTVNDPIEKNRIISSAHHFIQNGLLFSKNNPPEEFSSRTAMMV